MERELAKLTMKELRSIARSEGITLGYAGSRKSSTVSEIVTWRRNQEKEAIV